MILKQPLTVEQALKKANRCPKIQLQPENPLHAKAKTLSLKEFISEYFKLGNPATIKVRGRDWQCHSHSNRSLGDIWKLCLYYYPETTLLEVRNIIKELSKEKLIDSFICCTINKRVYTKGDRYGGNHFPHGRDEFGWSWDEKLNQDVKNTTTKSIGRSKRV